MMTHQDQWANISATMWGRLWTHLSKESGQVSTQIAQGPRKNITKKLDLQQATHWALTAQKTRTATKPMKASIPILMRHQKHTNTTPLMKKANQRIFSKESRSVVIKCNQRYSSWKRTQDNTLHSRKETTSSENVYLTHITTNVLLCQDPWLDNWILREYILKFQEQLTQMKHCIAYP